MAKTLRLLTAVPEDVPELVQIYFGAFQNPHSLQAFPRIRSVREWWEDMLSTEIQDEGACFWKIVEDELDEGEGKEGKGEGKGKIVAYAKWNRPKQGIEGNEEDEGSGLPESWPEGGDKRVCDEFFGQLARRHHEIMGRRPHWCEY
jgi:hypothetical protein